MSDEILVTVVGKLRRGDVCLDAGVPVATLLGPLLRHYGAPGAERVVLTDDRGAVLDPGCSLHAAGVANGSTLTLRTAAADGGAPVAAGPTPAPVSSMAPSPAAASGGSAVYNPLERTRAVLPTHLGGRARLWTSARCAVSRRSTPARSAPVRGAAPSPAELTLPDAPGPIARWRRAWEDTSYLHRLDSGVVRPQLARCATIAVVSPKGGVGKTTVTALLGTLMAHLRRDLVVAVDANPDYGSLGRVLCAEHRFYVDDLMAALESASQPTFADFNAWLGAGPHGLRVLPAPTDPRRMNKIGFETYSDVIGRMKDFAGMLLVDCGTGLHEPNAQAAVASADQVIVVSDADPATASLVSEAVARLNVEAPLTLVVNKVPKRGIRLDLGRLAATLPEIAGMVCIPADATAALRLGLGSFDWKIMPPSWQLSVRELAAVLIAGWSDLGLQRG